MFMFNYEKNGYKYALIFLRERIKILNATSNLFITKPSNFFTLPRAPPRLSCIRWTSSTNHSYGILEPSV